MIRPALTPEEWAKGGFGEECSAFISPQDPGNPKCVAAFTEGELRASCEHCTTWTQGASFRERRHALAALALHGHPFGFTREMLSALSRCADDAERWNAEHGWAQDYSGGRAAIDTVRNALAARLEALLPPCAPDSTTVK